MTPIATAEEMRERDRRAVDQLGIPSLILMENAARGAADILATALGSIEGRRVVILCGKGNNGGDGLAIARHVAILGGDPVCVLLHSPDAYAGDAGVQLDILRRSHLCEITTWEEFDRGEIADAVVDAMLGTGATGELRGAYEEAVLWGNAADGLKLAVDLPTGIDADSGRASGATFAADLTVTMGALKPGLLLNDGAAAAGDLYVAHIGAPPELYGDVRLALLDAPRAADSLPEIRRDWNKYDRGRVLVVAGSRGMTGAAVMTAESALRTGAGLVILAIPDAAADMPQGLMPEIMTRYLPSGNDGSFDERALDGLRDELPRLNGIAIGPGLSKSPGAAAMVRELVRTSPAPVVLDADGLNAFAGRADDLRDRHSDLVITPHHGEMARLLGIDASEIGADPVGTARAAAARTGAVVVLKGAPTVAASRDGRAWINAAGNPGMATGGTGDVLAGTILSIVAQRGDALEGALAAVYLHSLAADIAAESGSLRALTATDIIAAIPEAYRRLAGEER